LSIRYSSRSNTCGSMSTMARLAVIRGVGIKRVIVEGVDQSWPKARAAAVQLPQPSQEFPAKNQGYLKDSAAGQGGSWRLSSTETACTTSRFAR
jgi:hypothetical protein